MASLKSVDLNKLKTEIDTRKNSKNLVSSKLGESVTVSNGKPRDEFLNGLLTSLHTGKSTPASNLIKLVENKTAAKNGEKFQHNVSETEVVQSRKTQPVINKQPNLHESNIDMSPERDELLYAEFEKRKKQTLADSIESHIKPGTTQNNKQNLQEQTSQINEGYLVENVKKIVNTYLSENFGPVIEEAIKSTIIEMYAVERIKEVLHENKEMVKTLVYETIREIQAKNKKAS